MCFLCKAITYKTTPMRKELIQKNPFLTSLSYVRFRSSDVLLNPPDFYPSFAFQHSCFTYTLSKKTRYDKKYKKMNVKVKPPLLLNWYDTNAREMPWRISPSDRIAGVTPSLSCMVVRDNASTNYCCYR